MPEHVTRSDPELGAKRCKSCGALILWTITESGLPMPVDFAQTAEGTVAISVGTDDRGRRVWRSRIGRIGDPGVRRKSHFATCPFAVEHRRR